MREFNKTTDVEDTHRLRSSHGREIYVGSTAVGIFHLISTFIRTFRIHILIPDKSSYVNFQIRSYKSFIFLVQ